MTSDSGKVEEKISTEAQLGAADAAQLSEAASLQKTPACATCHHGKEKHQAKSAAATGAANLACQEVGCSCQAYQAP